MYIYIYSILLNDNCEKIGRKWHFQTGKIHGKQFLSLGGSPQVFSNSVWMVDGSSSLIPMAPWGDMNET